MTLASRLDAGLDKNAALDTFLAWVTELGLTLYPAQEEAVLALWEGRHVVLNTPTGSGKSLVAQALQLKVLASGGRSYYTAPIKALVSEKFFALCRDFGAERVGMLTGDATINPKAPVICCTAEILSNLALREGRHFTADACILDEFHYYGDRDRGSAWQIPLISLPDTQFLLMSATLGDMTEINQRLETLSSRPVTWVRSADRPVPLEFSYSEKPLLETLQLLVQDGRAPAYVVSFTQREATELALELMSSDFCSRDEKRAIAAEISGFRFDSPFGKDIKRLIGHGIGVHHAGMLPKYRLLVERLAQKGVLKIISGTDTLGVGVNVPIRTVLLTKLCKYDGAGTRVLSVREFHQLAGRAGRRGFDDRGWVVAQAPEHVIENKRLEAKEHSSNNKKKFPRKKPPERGYVHFDDNTFRRLVGGDPEALRSQLDVSHGMLLNVLARELSHGRRDGGYKRIVSLIAQSHESEAKRRHLRRRAADVFRSLVQAGIVELVRPDFDPRPYAHLAPGLRQEFSIFQTLALWLVHALAELPVNPDPEQRALEVISLVESILEDPNVVLERQRDKKRGEAIGQMKAEGVEYDERMRRLEEVDYDKPMAEAIYLSFDLFRETRPWVRQDNVSPKSVARDVLERFASFSEYVRDYGLERSEGVLLRYLTEVYKTLTQTLPEAHRTPEIETHREFLRALLAHADASLVREWESMLSGESTDVAEAAAAPSRRATLRDVLRDPSRRRSRLRAELHALLKALVAGNVEDAASLVYGGEGEVAWDAQRLGKLWQELVGIHGPIRFDHQARLSEHTQLLPAEGSTQVARQSLLNRDGEVVAGIEVEVDLERAEEDGPLLRLVGIG